ncbi:1-phosphofructokinase family hexose kinase [Curtobacterium sp. SP.BCo]|uniref:1-phosphofructokinase family hexose kinase n=1 Tax=Curtobacterium sp. SP.BCo TaxID=3435229 RepID=UPI003F73EB6C
MILVVTPNPAVDVTYRVAEQRIGETQRVLDVARRPGGKGLNVGRVLATTGTDTHAVLPLGGASGRWIADTLDELGLAHTDVPVTGETRTTVTVVDDLEHPTMFGEPGPVVTPEEWATVTSTVERLLATGAVTVLVVSGSLPRGADPAVVGRWVVAARAHGVPSVVDCSGAALLAAAEAGGAPVFSVNARASVSGAGASASVSGAGVVCKPNRSELLEATGAPDERAGALDLLRRGATAVVVSRGSDGIAAHTVDGVVEVPAVVGVRGNPTGAGDAATAGLVTALGPGPVRVDEAALRTAAAFGAAAVLRPVAGEVDPEDVRRFRTDTVPTQQHDHRTGSPA